MQFVCELFNTLVVLYTRSGREFPKHKYLRTKSSPFEYVVWVNIVGSSKNPAPLTNGGQLRTRSRCLPVKRRESSQLLANSRC